MQKAIESYIQFLFITWFSLISIIDNYIIINIWKRSKTWTLCSLINYAIAWFHRTILGGAWGRKYLMNNQLWSYISWKWTLLCPGYCWGLSLNNCSKEKSLSGPQTHLLQIISRIIHTKFYASGSKISSKCLRSIIRI